MNWINRRFWIGIHVRLILSNLRHLLCLLFRPKGYDDVRSLNVEIYDQSFVLPNGMELFRSSTNYVSNFVEVPVMRMGPIAMRSPSPLSDLTTRGVVRFEVNQVFPATDTENMMLMYKLQSESMNDTEMVDHLTKMAVRRADRAKADGKLK